MGHGGGWGAGGRGRCPLAGNNLVTQLQLQIATCNYNCFARLFWGRGGREGGERWEGMGPDPGDGGREGGAGPVALSLAWKERRGVLGPLHSPPPLLPPSPPPVISSWLRRWLLHAWRITASRISCSLYACLSIASSHFSQVCTRSVIRLPCRQRRLPTMAVSSPKRYLEVN